MQSSTNLANQDAAYKARAPIDIVFENIEYSVNVEVDQKICKPPCSKKFVEKPILKGISGIAKGGEVTAIMGASGAGKTTLLNILACRISHTTKEKATPGTASGSLSANSLEYSYHRFGEFANYVMQTDVLLQTLTVRETLEYVAKLKLPLPKPERKEVVNELVKNLKLEKCIDTIVGGANMKGVSGGEKKRTSIAFELISDPQVLVLDEPTSGLDSLTAFIICSYLHRLATERKMTVLMTIHQPNSEIFFLFHRLILMVEGRCIYQGSSQNSVDYFGRMGFHCPKFSNPPDYFMSILHQESSTNVSNYPKYFETYDRELAPIVSQQIHNKNISAVEKRVKEVSFGQTLSAILKRDVINIIRNPMVFKARIMQTIILGLFVGGVYWKIDNDYVTTDAEGNQIANVDFYTVAGLFFFLSISGLMSSLSPVSIVFPKERVVFLKEEGSRLYGTFVFSLSRNIVELPFLIVIPLLWSCILYFMIGLALTAGQFFMFYFVLFLISLAGNSIGLLMGSAISEAKLISIFIPIFIMPLVLFSGFYKNNQDIPMWIGWIQYISPIKYSFIGFITNQLNSKNNQQIPVAFLDFEKGLTMWPAVGVLIGLCIFYRAVSIVFLYLGRTKLQ